MIDLQRRVGDREPLAQHALELAAARVTVIAGRDLLGQAAYFLPHLLALSTSSPFWQARRTGLKGYRLAAYDELPRTGLPELFRTQQEFDAYVAALVRAGVTRHEVLNDTATTRRTDWYSFRRAFVTAVAAAGTNAQVGMRLAGHRSMATHQRYHVPAALEIPAAAVPSADPFELALAAWVA